MTNPKIPFNAIPVMHLDGTIKDDTGRRVIVNSIGGPSWPTDRWKRALENVGGVVVWGPCQIWYIAKARVEGVKVKPGHKPPLKDKKFITQPSWCVRLDGYNMEITFIEKELTFI